MKGMKSLEESHFKKTHTHTQRRENVHCHCKLQIANLRVLHTTYTPVPPLAIHTSHMNVMCYSI